ncbi:membrane protein [Streptomyces parvulus]|nr:membrane protein [Streptomyces parvulus]
MPKPTADSVWRQFLTDSEQAIARSAPREPSARERTGHPAGNSHVGDAWYCDDPVAEPPWRHLDTRGRIHRLGRILAGAAALAVLLGLFSCLPKEPAGLPTGPESTSPPQTSSAVVESPAPAAPALESTDAA